MKGIRVAIVHNQESKSVEVTKRLTVLLEQSENKIDQENPELVISVGGDGTLLSAFHLYNHKLDQVQFLGVHTGHLGFYTDWRDYELEELVESLCNDHQKSVSYPLLDVRITYANGKPDKHFLALNESTIKRGNRTMVADISIKEDLFEKFRGDGLSISTPTGSTAYSLAAGGPILAPEMKAIVLAPLNPHILAIRPMVFPATERLAMKVYGLSQPAMLQIDGQNSQTIQEGDEVLVTASERRVSFIKLSNRTFYQILRRKLNLGK